MAAGILSSAFTVRTLGHRWISAMTGGASLSLATAWQLMWALWMGMRAPWIFRIYGGFHGTRLGKHQIKLRSIRSRLQFAGRTKDNTRSVSTKNGPFVTPTPGPFPCAAAHGQVDPSPIRRYHP